MPLFPPARAALAALVLGPFAAALPAAAQTRPADSTRSVVVAARPPAAPGFRWADPRRDRWDGADKVQHAALSFAIATSVQYLLVNRLGASERAALPVSLGFAAQVGLAKETADAYRPYGSGFSPRDLAADAVGVALAAAVVLAGR